MVPLSPWSSETKLASCDSPPSLVCGIASSGCERVPLFAGGVLSEKGLLQRKRHQRGSFQTPRHSKPRDLKTSPSSKETNFASNFPDVSLSESPTGKPRDLCPRDAERPPAPGGSGRQKALPCPGAEKSTLRGGRARVPRARPEGQTRLFRVVSWPAAGRVCRLPPALLPCRRGLCAGLGVGAPSRPEGCRIRMFPFFPRLRAFLAPK